uniref:Cystatin domain-containing protein n=1 Tax=Daphnia galeata TaxID=27404 RepID=A0A8J2WJA4_9CRUS|nr:unnamed protein product [Daphnia galeata]
MAHFLATTILLAVALLSVDAGRLNKRQVGFVGGFSPAKVDDADVLKIADFATTAVSANMNSTPVKLLKIVKAETQVVSGTNYKLNLELSGANSEVIPCEVVVFDQPWTKTQKLIRSSCTPKRKTTKRQVGGSVTGGYSPVDVNDAKVKEIASFASSAISANTNSGPVTLTKVVKAESQVVAGINFKLTLELNGAEGAILCEVIVFDQSWTQTRKLSESKCFPAKNALVKVGKSART